jgi:hypothetical protein
MRTPRTLLALLGLAALLLAGLQAVAGGEPLVLYAAPFLLLLGLLLSGRFIGEEAILALRAKDAPVLRPLRRRWSPVFGQALASGLERSTRQLRGPPAAVPGA